ncbi:hypothetical protein CEV31_3456 [Brucella thiophenivorans]|uniref:Uncharacterized protein n=1 Tax=Brucella thiophenivorans TaxID=571255 RepID=A0A256FF26_9HYPH|nr:hypothetical protein CEV31_3456 [Brucella thiophenivorans]
MNIFSKFKTTFCIHSDARSFRPSNLILLILAAVLMIVLAAEFLGPLFWSSL